MPLSTVLARAGCAAAVLVTSVAVGAPLAQAAAAPPGGAFRALRATRIHDTRQSQPAPKAAGGTFNVSVTGRGGVPSTGVAAVVLNVTSVASTGTGALTVWPAGATRPATSNVRFTAGRTVSNVVTVPTGFSGLVSVYLSGAASHVLVDVHGWYTTPGATAGTAGLLRPLTPARLVNTRSRVGGTTIPAKGTLNVQVTGRGGVPAAGAGAVVLNAIAYAPTAAGSLTVWPRGATRPTVSNVTFAAGQTVGGRAFAGLGTSGQVSVYNASASPVDVLVDISGWFTNATADATGAGYFKPVPSKRTYNTGTSPLGTTPRTIRVTGLNGVPTADVVAVAITTTVVNPSASGYVRSYPAEPPPGTADQYHKAGQAIANHAIAKPSATGRIQLRNSAGTLQALVDTSGYFVRLPAPPAFVTTTLPNGRVGVAYDQQLAATGGLAPYTYTFVSGSLAPGLTLHVSGRYYGAPTTAGAYDMVLRVTDAYERSTTRAFTHVIEAAPAPLTITTATLPDAQVGVPYSTTLAAAGGVTPYSWSADNTTPLPPGLSLSGAGVIAGTPTAAQQATSVTVQVVDTQPRQATRSLTLTVTPAPPPLTITTTSLPSGQRGTAYSATLAASGGTPGYTWGVAAGTLPTGLSLAPTGGLSGTPSAAGTSNVTFRVTDAAAQSQTKALAITVADIPVPAITTAALPGARLNTPYHAVLAASGGTTPYTWASVGTALPPGLSISAAGVLSGTPTSVGGWTPTFRVTDANLQWAQAMLPVTVTAGSDWTQPHHDMGRTGYAANETSITTANAAGLREVWSLDAGAGASAVAGGVLYTAGTLPDEPGESALTAYDIATSTVLWRVPLLCGPGAVAVTSSAVLFPCNGRLRAYSLTGSHALLWDTAVTDPGAGSVNDFAVMGDRVVALEGGAVFAYRLTDGVRLWRQFLPTGASGNQVAVSGTTALVAMGDRLRSYSTTNGAIGWTVTGSAFSVVADNGAVYAAMDGELRRLDLATGAEQWATSTSQRIDSVLGGDGTRVLALWRQEGDFGIETRLHAYLEGTGAPDWESYTPNRVLHVAITPSLAWVTSADYGGMFGSDTGAVTAVSMADGAVVHTLDTGRRIFSATAISDGRLVVGRSTSLRVYGLDNPIPRVTTKVLRSGHTGRPYQDTLTAAGGTAPYTWSLATGPLPTGITLNGTTGTISGTATIAAAPRITVRVTDALGSVATRSLVVQVSAPGAGSWPTIGGDGARTGLAASETTIGLDTAPQIGPLWSGGEIENGEAGDLAVAGDKVYVSRWRSGDIHAYSRTAGAATGRTPLWVAHTDDPEQDLVQTGITVAGNRLLVGTLQGLYSFDATTGAKQWRAPYVQNNPGGSAPLVIGTRVFVGDGDGGLHAFDLATGAPSWTTPFALQTYPGVPATIDGLATDGTRLYAAAACDLYAVDPATGATLWKKVLTPSGDPNCAYAYRSVPLVANGIVYAGSQSGMMAFDAVTGAVVWQRSLSAGGSMALSNGALLLGTVEGDWWTLRAVDPLTGALLWRSASLTGPPRIVVAGDLVLTNTGDGVTGFDIRTGDLAWAGLPGSANIQLHQPAVVDGAIYHVGRDRMLRAYGVPE
ncbi:MAG TPA: putative Ig domain-containing protein [Frankiaceae bacterium]|nr:putative Ig domain-containing protein [Frankiaceae bacterium]